MQNRVLKLDARDDALIALADLRRGEEIQFNGDTYRLVSDVRAKHKFLIADVVPAGNVIMYGVLVGKAVKPIRRGRADSAPKSAEG